jgi:hypothetical protein
VIALSSPLPRWLVLGLLALVFATILGLAILCQDPPRFLSSELWTWIQTHRLQTALPLALGLTLGFLLASLAAQLLPNKTSAAFELKQRLETSQLSLEQQKAQKQALELKVETLELALDKALQGDRF